MDTPDEARSVGTLQRVAALPGWSLWLLVLGYGIASAMLPRTIARACFSDEGGCLIPALVFLVLFVALPLAAGLALASASGNRAIVTRWALILAAIESALLALTAVAGSNAGNVFLVALIALIAAPAFACARMSMRQVMRGLSATVALVEMGLGGVGGIVFVLAIGSDDASSGVGLTDAVPFGSVFGGVYAWIGGLIGAPIGVGIGRLLRDRSGPTDQPES